MQIKTVCLCAFFDSQKYLKIFSEKRNKYHLSGESQCERGQEKPKFLSLLAGKGVIFYEAIFFQFHSGKGADRTGQP